MWCHSDMEVLVFSTLTHTGTLVMCQCENTHGSLIHITMLSSSPCWPSCGLCSLDVSGTWRDDFNTDWLFFYVSMYRKKSSGNLHWEADPASVLLNNLLSSPELSVKNVFCFFFIFGRPNNLNLASSPHKNSNRSTLQKGVIFIDYPFNIITSLRDLVDAIFTENKRICYSDSDISLLVEGVWHQLKPFFFFSEKIQWYFIHTWWFYLREDSVLPETFVTGPQVECSFCLQTSQDQTLLNMAGGQQAAGGVGVGDPWGAPFQPAPPPLPSDPWAPKQMNDPWNSPSHPAAGAEPWAGGSTQSTPHSVPVPTPGTGRHVWT